MTVGIHMPNMWNAMLLEIVVQTLTNTNQAVLVPTTEVQQLQPFFSRRRIGHKLSGRFGIGGRRKSADPSEDVEVSEAEVQRLAPTH